MSRGVAVEGAKYYCDEPGCARVIPSGKPYMRVKIPHHVRHDYAGGYGRICLSHSLSVYQKVGRKIEPRRVRF